ncbi:MAG: hypothetical protein ABW109_05470 [Candidatus Thiodiazotropha sp. 6PLUC4]
MRLPSLKLAALATVLWAGTLSTVFGHGDVAPQPVDTSALKLLGE